MPQLVPDRSPLRLRIAAACLVYRGPSSRRAASSRQPSADKGLSRLRQLLLRFPAVRDRVCRLRARSHRGRGAPAHHARADRRAAAAEYTLAFIGRGRFQDVTDTLKTVTESSDTDDIVRRQLATSVRAGLLRFLTREAVPPGLAIEVKLGSEQQRPAVAGDRWNNWVFSLEGSASFDGEESSRDRQLGLSASADRITPDWKITFGGRDRSRDRGVRPRRGGARQGGTPRAGLQLARRQGARRALVARRAGRDRVVHVRQHRARRRRGAGRRVQLLSVLDVHAAAAASAVCGRRQPVPVLRGDALRQARGDAAEPRAVADARAARAVGLD